jgi:cytochrome c553
MPGDFMRTFGGVLAVALFAVLAIGAQTPQAQTPPPAAAPGPAWAFPVPDAVQPVTMDMTTPRKLAGSTKTYTQTEIDDLFNAVDWLPGEHGPAPAIVLHGRPPAAMACGVCHLMSGMGHPESSTLAGLSADFILRQMADFKSGDRKDNARMNGIAQATTEDEWKQAAQYFASLPQVPWTKVVEAATVPKTFLNGGRMRLPHPDGSTEPIGNRIIVVPQDADRVTARDPKTGFIAYVPPDSLAKGEALATAGGGKTIPCFICHGQGLKGAGDVPRIAGGHPTYIARQLYNFRSGASNGGTAQLMKATVANLTDDDILALAAYVAAQAP